MDGTALIAGALLLPLTWIGGQLYRRLWLVHGRLALVPTGYGAFLAPVMLGMAVIVGASKATLWSLSIVTIATAVYWIDDAVTLSARVRLSVAFAAGVGVATCWLSPNPGLTALAIGSVCVAAGLACVMLSQMTNFQDGADLNLAVFIALTAGAILIFTPADREWAAIALAALAFTFGFGAINARPRMLYLGDAGSFAFAGLLTIMAAAFIENFGNMAPEAAIPAALPAFDVAYVFAVRVREGHDLLTRNYLHLYQRMNRRRSGFGYLLPQPTNAAVCLGVAFALQEAGLGRIASVVVALPLVTIPFYFTCRRLFLTGPVEGPLHETAR